ncbi:MAG TPA: AsmA-like C-terminal region-containing protein, partial [Pirellulales bacterium]
GRISAQAPLTRLREVAAWSASGSLVLGGVQVYAWTSKQTTAAFQLAANRLTVSNLSGDLDGGRMTGSLGLDLAAPYRTTANFELVNGDLSRFNALPGRLHPPLNVIGRYSVRTSLQGTLRPLEVHAAGGFLAQSARLGRIAVDRVSFVYRGSQDAVRVEDFQASLFGGQAAGSAALSLTPAGPPGEAALRWQSLDLAALAPLAPQLAAGVRGRTTGSVQLRVPPGQLTQWSDWTAGGHAQIVGLGLAAYELGQFSADFGLRERKLQATRIALAGPMGSLQASAQLGLSAPLDYTAHVQIKQANLAVLSALVQPPGSQPTRSQPARPGNTIAGQLAGLVDVQGTLEPLTVTGKASVTATDVMAERVKIERATLEARFDRRRVELTTAEALLYDGRASASGTINLDDASRLQAKLQGVNLAGLASALGYAPGHLAAVANGSLTLEIAGGQLPHPSAWQAHAVLNLPEIKSGKAYLGTLNAKADYRQGNLSYQASGELLGGNVKAQGELPAAPGKQPFSLGTGHWQLAGAQLDQLAALANRPALLPLSGTFSAAADVHAPRAGESTIGSGNWLLADVHWNDQVLISRLGGAIRLTPTRFDLVNAQGSLAGGTLLLASSVDLAHPRASAFSLQLIDAQLAQLSALTGRRFAARGNLDLALRGNLARPWQIYGTAVIGDATLAGLRLADARLSLAAEFDPLTTAGQFEVSQATASVASGRATGKLKADFRGQLAIQASASFTNVDLRTISSQLSSAGRMLSGKASGSVVASGQNVRSLNDLSGTIRAQLSRAQAMSLPLLSNVVPFLSGGASSATVFDDGRFAGSFSKGVLRVRHFTLNSDSLQLFADGTITSTLRLHLNVTVRTNQQATGGLLSTVLAVAIPLAGPTPIGLLIEANRLLANQTVNLVVGGTAKHPSISIRPAPLLAEEAVRFFMLQVPGGSAMVP